MPRRVGSTRPRLGPQTPTTRAREDMAAPPILFPRRASTAFSGARTESDSPAPRGIQPTGQIPRQRSICRVAGRLVSAPMCTAECDILPFSRPVRMTVLPCDKSPLKPFTDSTPDADLPRSHGCHRLVQWSLTLTTTKNGPFVPRHVARSNSHKRPRD